MIGEILQEGPLTPDLSHSATRGIILGMIRDVAQDPVARIEFSAPRNQWTLVSKAVIGQDPRWFPTEEEALVNALIHVWG